MLDELKHYNWDETTRFLFNGTPPLWQLLLWANGIFFIFLFLRRWWGRTKKRRANPMMAVFFICMNVFLLFVNQPLGWIMHVYDLIYQRMFP